jgi:hypothetical protein
MGETSKFPGKTSKCLGKTSKCLRGGMPTSIGLWDDIGRTWEKTGKHGESMGGVMPDGIREALR